MGLRGEKCVFTVCLGAIWDVFMGSDEGLFCVLGWQRMRGGGINILFPFLEDPLQDFFSC